MSGSVHVVVEGDGPPLLLIHGSAADHSTWVIQLAALRSKTKLITWDRRGTGRSASLVPAAPGVASGFPTVEEHAQDAAALIRAHAGGGPVVAVGSSFGGVVALELCRSMPALVSGAVLLEPPLAKSDELPPIPEHFLRRYDELAEAEGGPAAAEFFLRSVLGDEAWERVPRPFQERSKALHRAIRHDIAALGAYPVRYAELHRIRTPVLLLGGERSAPFYRPTLEALQRSLGNATLERLPGAGHMMHADVHRRFNERLMRFVASVNHRAA